MTVTQLKQSVRKEQNYGKLERRNILVQYLLAAQSVMNTQNLPPSPKSIMLHMNHGIRPIKDRKSCKNFTQMLDKGTWSIVGHAKSWKDHQAAQEPISSYRWVWISKVWLWWRVGLTSLDRNVNRNINSAKGHHLDVKRWNAVWRWG